MESEGFWHFGKELKKALHSKELLYGICWGPQGRPIASVWMFLLTVSSDANQGPGGAELPRFAFFLLFVVQGCPARNKEGSQPSLVLLLFTFLTNSEEMLGEKFVCAGFYKESQNRYSSPEISY